MSKARTTAWIQNALCFPVMLVLMVLVSLVARQTPTRTDFSEPT
jgi:hypothetical protein